MISSELGLFPIYESIVLVTFIYLILLALYSIVYLIIMASIAIKLEINVKPKVITNSLQLPQVAKKILT